ncbi:hypothetical protein TIFTF001_025470 [Ficus carica]|uniref:Uncharacterized protein n=1 Tax=Ficus carica TaxID=3494 RepID=A0AA88DGN2_FICCA|nr:hypothetical protein TIFTF001_025470 [Ficus carica]
MDLSEEQSSSSPSKSLGVIRASARAAVEEDKSMVPVSEGTGLVGPAVAEQEKKKLNPNAKAWDPKADGASEEDRKYGKCVETVDLHNGADLDGNATAAWKGDIQMVVHTSSSHGGSYSSQLGCRQEASLV